MTYRVRVISLGVFMALLATLLLGGVAQAQALDQKGVNKSGEVKLNPKQRAEFVEGAEKVAGLNDRQIAAALKDPQTIRAIPVEVKTDVSKQPLVSPTAPKPGFAAPQAALYSSTLTCDKKATNIYRQTVLTYTVRHTWEYSKGGKKVLSYSVAPRGKVAFFAKPFWRFQGPVANQSKDRYMGNRRGVYSYQTGKFVRKIPLPSNLQIGPLGTFEPWIEARLYPGGKYTSTQGSNGPRI